MSNGSNVGERLSSVETTVDMHEKRIGKLEENTNLIHKMNVLLEVQTDLNKNQQKQIEGFQDIVRSVDTNLTNLNNSQEKLNEKLDTIDKRVDKIENVNEQSKEDDTISIKKIFTNVIKWAFYSLPVAVLLAYVMSKLGF